MSIKIRRYKNGQFTDEIWNGSFASAQDRFCQSVRDGAVDCVEIRDADDKVIFHYPLEMHLTTPGG